MTSGRPRGASQTRPAASKLSLRLQTQFQEALSLHQRGSLDRAEAIYQAILRTQPKHFFSMHYLGVVAYQTGRLETAFKLISEAIKVNPSNAAAYSNFGLVLQKLKRFDEAVASFERALALEPANAAAYNNRGIALKEVQRLDEALASYDQALALKPDYVDACYNRGNLLKDLERFEEALSSYERGLALNPDFEFLRSKAIHTRMKLCRWDGLQRRIDDLKHAVLNTKQANTPFSLLGLFDSPDLHKQAAMRFSQTRHPPGAGLGPISKRVADGKIRVAYFSADFHNHATSYLMAELFEAHNTDRFKLYGFSFGPDSHDEMRSRVSSAFDQFLDVRQKSDRDVARLAREQGIDIAIDLKGYTEDARTDIFAERCAPIQVNFLGYPGTMGSNYMDYVIADRIVIPEDRQSDYTEKVVLLPHCYQVNDSHRMISTRVYSKQEFDLPESGFVFCCFNQAYKIQPATFDGWMRILAAVEGSVLWLMDDNPAATLNLRKEAEVRGIDGRRLVFARRLPLDEHLARHRLADLFIDTLPYNAHTTASDALWAGLPILTCMGRSFASRVAASLLNAIGLPELVTESLSQYEKLAIELALNPEKLKSIRMKLERNRTTSPLFNGKMFARHLECAYEKMYARYQTGAPPEQIQVQSSEPWIPTFAPPTARLN